MVSREGMVQRINLMVEEEYSDLEPGAVILLARRNQVVYRRAIGMANLEHRVPLDPRMVFRIASLTKPFTAQAILLLAEDGKVRLDNTVDQYLTDGSAFSGITVEHLLSHTSGLVSYTSLPEWWTHRRQDISVPDLIGLFRDRPSVALPGARWDYNNSGYALLGALIERVTGAPYGLFIKQRIFDPLKMVSSEYEDSARVIPGRVQGYQQTAEGFQNADLISVTQMYAAGGLLSTVDDLALWSDAIFSGQLLKPESLRRAFTPFGLRDGSATRYGCGWFLSESNGTHLVEHLGSLPGFAHFMIGAPAQGLFAVVLSNRAAQQTVPEALTRSIMEIALAEGAN